MQGTWRLVLRNDLEQGEKPAMELFRLSDDPGQQHNVIERHSDVAAKLRQHYNAWWNDISRDFVRPAEIVVGDPQQNSSKLTCFEWHSSQQWQQSAVRRGFAGNGYWTIRVAQAGKYEMALRRWPEEVDAAITYPVQPGRAIAADRARLRVGTFDEQQPVTATTRAITFEVSLPAGSNQLQTWLTETDGTSRGAYYVTVRQLTSP